MVSPFRLRGRAAGCAVLGVLALAVAQGPATAAEREARTRAAADMAGDAKDPRQTAEPAIPPDPIPPARWTEVPAKPFPRASDDRLTRALARHRDRPVLIHFWASWCPPCREELPELQRIATTGPGHGIRVITVAVADRKKTVEDLFRELGVDLPVIHDPDQSISRTFGAYGLPTSYLLDRRHRIRFRAVGVVDWHAAPTRASLARISR